MPDNTKANIPTGGKSRRRVLKTALLGGASITAFKLAPESWTRPVVEAVSLPVHAQMSVILPDGPWASGSPVGPGPARDRGLGDRLLNAILPEAKAGEDAAAECPATFGICIDKIDDSTIRVRIGFNGDQFDDRNVGVSESGGLFTFAGQFGGGTWNVNGELSADGETWEGWVEGQCPLLIDVSLQQTTSRGPLGRVGAALANSVVPVARAGLQADLAAPLLEQPWTANKDVLCGLTTDVLPS